MEKCESKVLCGTYVLLSLPVATGLFSWVWAAAKINDAETLRLVGMDHYVLLRFVKFGMNLTCM